MTRLCAGQVPVHDGKQQELVRPRIVRDCPEAILMTCNA